MKELIKIEALRLKMPPKLRPKAHEMRSMVIGGPPLKRNQIEKMVDILNANHTKNIEWLESMKPQGK